MRAFVVESFLTVIAKTDFKFLWFSQVLSQISLHLINFVIILRIFEATGSSFAVSLVWIFYVLPALLLGPFTGTIVDNASRRQLLIATNLAQAVVVLFYLPAQVAIWPIYTVIFVYSLLNQIFIPAEAAILPYIVQRKLLPAANTLFLFTVYASFVVGLGFAGPVVKAMGERSPFILISALLVLAALAVSKLPGERKKKDGRKPSEFWQRFVEGYAFIQENPNVLFPLLLLVAAGITLPIVAVLTPAVVVNVLKIELLDASLLLVVPAGLGAILGGLAAVRLLRNMRKKRVISWGIFMAAVSLLWLGVVIPGMPQKALFGSIAAFVLGVSFTLSIIPAQTLLQEKTPDRLRGRVFGALNFLITAASLFPVLFAATLAEFFGEISLILLMSLILFTVGVASVYSDRILRFYHVKG